MFSAQKQNKKDWHSLSSSIANGKKGDQGEKFICILANMIGLGL
jgi:hypothetical protein